MSWSYVGVVTIIIQLELIQFLSFFYLSMNRMLDQYINILSEGKEIGTIATLLTDYKGGEGETLY